MRLVLESFSAGAVLVVMAGFAVRVMRDAGYREFAAKSLGLIWERFTESFQNRGKAPYGTGRHLEPDRVVRSHPVLSDRLMDSPTGRLWPSERHRVPPWVTSSNNPSGMRKS